MSKKLIQHNGQPTFGILENLVDEINHADYDFKSPMGKKRSAFLKKMSFNQFQFIGLFNKDVVIGCAIANIKWLSNAFIYLFDIKTNTLEEFSFLQPFARKTELEHYPQTGSATFHKGKNRIEIKASQAPRQRLLHAKLGDDIEVQAILQEPIPFKPLAICTQAGYRGWTFTQKATALPTAGSIRWRDKQIDLGKTETLGCYDWSCGFMRRETCWNWASLSGRLDDGRRIGFNLASGVNETGFTENGFWINDQFTKIDTLHFDFNHSAEGIWRIQSFDKKVDLEFKACGKRAEKINLWLLASNFSQFIGQFYGKLSTDHGETIHLTGQYGLTEDHYAKW